MRKKKLLFILASALTMVTQGAWAQTAVDLGGRKDISFTTDISCPVPTNLDVVNITNNQATATWNGGAESYKVMIGEENTATTTFDFENQQIPASFTNDTEYPWLVTNATANNGTYSIKSGNYHVSKSTSSIQVTFTFATAGTISFAAKCICDSYDQLSDYDYGTFYIDNVQQGGKIVYSDTFTSYQYEVEAGTHTFMWRYKKDGVTDIRDDCFYVDDITIQITSVSSWTEYTANEQSYTFSSLTPETAYQVKVKGYYGTDGYSDETQPVSFTTFASNASPYGLSTTGIYANAAMLNWSGVQDSYNVRYRTPAPEIVEDFEDADEFSANWTVISNDNANDDKLGIINTEKRNGRYGFRFSSYDKASDYNQYLISPDVSGAKSVEFWYKPTTHSAEIFKVGYSTTGNNVADFNNNWGNEISIQSSSDWTKYELNLPDGVKYVAINYYSDYKYYLYIDDITINCGSAGDWVNKTNVTSPLAIDGLEPETKYEWQVQGIYSPENTDWSDMAFTTSDIVKLDATKTLAENQSAYGTATKFLLDRTLTAGQWNTFASPFAIELGDMDKYFGAGAKVRKLGTTTIEEGNILSLNFVTASSIDAGHPYIVKPAANVDFSADGKEFEGVNLNSATETPTTTTYVDFKPTLGKTTVTDDPENILMLTTSGTLVNPSAVGDIKGFRGYFQLHDPVGGASRTRAYVIDFGDGETTSIIPIRTQAGAAISDGATYDLQGRKVAQPTQKGIYIQNGKKLIIK